MASLEESTCIWILMSVNYAFSREKKVLGTYFSDVANVPS
jgi:hypothetical protein